MSHGYLVRFGGCFISSGEDEPELQKICIIIKKNMGLPLVEEERERKMYEIKKKPKGSKVFGILFGLLAEKELGLGYFRLSLLGFLPLSSIIHNFFSLRDSSLVLSLVDARSTRASLVGTSDYGDERHK